MTMIRVENLKKSFGDLEVIKDMSTVVEEKEVICVIGPSGSGKSTFLRCLNRLEEITGGHVYIEGVDITSPKIDINKIRQDVGMVFQQFNLFPHKSVLENVILAPMKVKKSDRKASEKKAYELLDKVGLREKAKAIRANFPAARNSASPLRAHLRWIRKSCSSMSRLPRSIPRWWGTSWMS